MNAVARIANALELPFSGRQGHDQDWGIVHADPRRLSEFIDFAFAHEAAVPYEHELLAELILQSSEEKLQESSLTVEEERLLVQYIESHRSKFPMSWKYWTSLDENEWKVVRYLTRIAE